MNSVVQLRPDQPPRTPPINLEAEQAVLGALLLWNDLWRDLAIVVKAADFSEELHRRIFDLAGKMIGDGQTASPVTLKTFLGEHDLGGVTLPQYLARLAAEAVSRSSTVA